MSGYRLKDDGFAGFKKILRGREWVGRVVRHAEGGYVGVIGTDSARGATEREAFEEAAARAMGYKSAAVVRAHNSRVRARKRAYNSVADAIGRRLINSDVKSQLDIIDRVGNSPEGYSLLLHGFARQLKRK